jgi:two-component system, NarL family, sensor histidine kinase UhpB
MAQQTIRWREWLTKMVPTKHSEMPHTSSQDGAVGQSRLVLLGTLMLGVLMAWVAGWLVVALNRNMVSPAEADAAAAASGQTVLPSAWFTLGEENIFPAGKAAEIISIPDEWANSRPQQEGSGWYRIHFEIDSSAIRDQLQAVYLERACSQVQVFLNGQLLYKAGNAEQPLTRQCYQSHVIPLPSFLLRGGDNQLDLKILGYPIEKVVARQRAAGLGEVRVGDWNTLRARQEAQIFWGVTLGQIIGGILLVLGIFAICLAWVRRLGYLRHFGLLTLFWAAVTSRQSLSYEFLSTSTAEMLMASLFAPMTLFATRFLLDYAGFTDQQSADTKRVRWVNAVLRAQVVLMPLTLWFGRDHLFLLSRAWFGVFALEMFAAVFYFLWFASRVRRTEFLLTCATLGAVVALMGIELGFQFGVVKSWGWNVTYFVMPILFAVVSFRLIQVYAGALESAQGVRKQLEKRVQEISGEIERNFTQIAELRVDQIAEKERKRIAADLHDDLGAKLLTIVHTSDNDRISSLAREALDEMRLSVRGLTGRPMRLPDALADWRAEMVLRLGQAGIEVDWRHQKDLIDMPLSARTFVQTTRIIREAISNVIKHSQASHVMVQSAAHEKTFEISIQDNGIGISLEADARLDRGHGMTTMKHRAKQLNGQCLVESGAGFGTVIRLSLPLELETASMVNLSARSSNR